MKLNQKSVFSIIFSTTLAISVFSLCFTSCETTKFTEELYFLKTSTIKPEKQKGFDKNKSKYIQMQPAVLIGGRKKDNQHTCLKFYGTVDNDVLTIDEAYYFDNSPTGWTEASFAAKGQLKITGKKNGTYDVITPVELEFPQKAKLRIKDSVLIGDEALAVLNNRLDRIKASVDFLKTPTDYIKDPKYINYFSFEQNAGSHLFPEKYAYVGNAVKIGNKPKFGKNKGNYILGDGIFWNAEYTEAAFPEYMWEIRNSGTLYKDWQHDFDLFYYLYDWEFFFGEGAKLGNLSKISWK